MSRRQPNILFLTVDAMRVDRTGLGGYDRPTTPNLDRLAAKSTVLTNHVAQASFTQPAFPSIFTSSRPLSFGGYDNGVCGRPQTLFKTLHDVGYETFLISTFPWVSRYYGYDEGIDHEDMAFPINALVGVASGNMATSISESLSGRIDRGNMKNVVVPNVWRLLENLRDYCLFRLQNQAFDRRHYHRERLVRNGYKYRQILNIISKHEAFLERDSEAYIDLNFNETPRAHNWIAQDWRLSRKISTMLYVAIQAGVGRFASDGGRDLDEHFGKRYVDGATLADRLIDAIKTRRSGQPFFIWSHFFDPHVPYCPGRGRDWRGEAPEYLAALGHDPAIDLNVAVSGRPKNDDAWRAWSALYDAAICYTDEQLGRVINAVEELGLADETIIVIGSDHGEELGEHGDISHHFLCYEHNIRVPFIVHVPGRHAETITGMTTHLDLAPTIAGLANAPIPEGWEGRNLLGDDLADIGHVLIENFFGGNCLFEDRPLYIGVRTPRHKFLWKEYRDPNDRLSADGHELYDLAIDPQELHNIYRDDHPTVREMRPIIAQRLAQIPEISSGRISAAFGEVGTAAVACHRSAPTGREGLA